MNLDVAHLVMHDRMRRMATQGNIPNTGDKGEPMKRRRTAERTIVHPLRIPESDVLLADAIAQGEADLLQVPHSRARADVLRDAVHAGLIARKQQLEGRGVMIDAEVAAGHGEDRTTSYAK